MTAQMADRAHSSPMHWVSSSMVARLLLAAIAVLAPIVASGWFALCPQYGNPSCPTSADPGAALAAVQAAPAGLESVFLLANLLAPYLVPMSILGLGLVAWPWSPRLALSGVVLGWIGAIPWGLFAQGLFNTSAVAGVPGATAGYVAATAQFFGDWHVLAIAAGWVLGHLLGYLLLGLALRRAAPVPQWAGTLMVIAVPIMGPVAYGSGLGVLQVGGYLAIALASIPVALTLVRREARAD
jgi:hypothetical protein